MASGNEGDSSQVRSHFDSTWWSFLNKRAQKMSDKPGDAKVGTRQIAEDILRRGANNLNNAQNVECHALDLIWTA